MQKNIFKGTRGVAIYSNEDAGPFYLRLYVNCAEHGPFNKPTLGDPTFHTARRKSLAGALKKAQAMLELK